MTPKLVSRSWNVTSVVRNPEHKRDILEAGKNGPGKVDVLVASLEEVKSDADAQKILDQVKPDWVIWSAGELFSLSFSLFIFLLSLRMTRYAWRAVLISILCCRSGR